MDDKEEEMNESHLSLFCKECYIMVDERMPPIKTTCKKHYIENILKKQLQHINDLSINYK
jgi:hypothetical protein